MDLVVHVEKNVFLPLQALESVHVLPCGQGLALLLKGRQRLWWKRDTRESTLKRAADIRLRLKKLIDVASVGGPIDSCRWVQCYSLEKEQKRVRRDFALGEKLGGDVFRATTTVYCRSADAPVDVTARSRCVVMLVLLANRFDRSSCLALLDRRVLVSQVLLAHVWPLRGDIGLWHHFVPPGEPDQKKEEKRFVAIKCVSGDGLEQRQRLVRSVNALMDLQHVGIVRAFECFDLKDEMWLVMEEIFGGTLDESRRRHNFRDPVELAWISKRLLEAVHFIQSKGFVHGNISLNTVMLDIKPGLKLIGFGSVTVRHSDSSIDLWGATTTLINIVAPATKDNYAQILDRARRVVDGRALDFFASCLSMQRSLASLVTDPFLLQMGGTLADARLRKLFAKIFYRSNGFGLGEFTF